jgi:T-complex protein 1 subunit theta
MTLVSITDLVVGKVSDVSKKEEVMPLIRSAIMSKQYGHEDFLAEIITNACCKLPSSYLASSLYLCMFFLLVSVLPEKSTFNVDSIRISKIAVGFV